MNIFDSIWTVVLVIINIIILVRVFVGFPAKFKEKDKQIKELRKRIKQLENPNEEKGSPIFRDKPDWLR